MYQYAMSDQALNFIVIRGACEHNLRDVDVTIPRDTLTVVTGLSGSGKSSLAFDTIYAEGQRRYMESLSAYARQYLDQMHKPKVESVEGLSPAISIEQKTVSRNPRSTVGTVTEIYDYLRVLYANVGRAHCPQCGRRIEQQTVHQIVDAVMQMSEGTKVLVLAPLVRGRKGEYRQEMADALRQGFTRARIDGKMALLEDPPKLQKSLKHDISIVIDRLAIVEGSRTRLIEAVEASLAKADGLVEIQTADDAKVRMFSQHFACPECGISVDEITPRLFSFNSPYGMCKKCLGIGTLLEPDPDLVIPEDTRTLRTGALAPWADLGTEKSDRDEVAWFNQTLAALVANFGVKADVPWRSMPEKLRDLVLNGAGAEKMTVTYTTSRGTKHESRIAWEGFLPRLKRRYFDDKEDAFARYFRERVCADCGGYRLRREASSVRFGGESIGEFCRRPIEGALEFMQQAELTERERLVGGLILKEVQERLEFLSDVGLGYITLDRRAGTLSGGEAQRIRLATQIGSQLTGVLYVLDEPSIGLHQCDNDRLLESLKKLRDLGNTLIVVEHDEQTIREADYVIDLGPGAGRLGGFLVAAGTPEEVIAAPDSITGRYLRGEVRIETPRARRPVDPERRLIVRGAREHNLKSLDAAFPLGLFTCVTGVSGGGKSTLVNDILFHALSNFVYRSGLVPGAHDRIDGLELIDKVVDVDQSPIGRTPRSNPVTYTGVFGPMRDLFAQTPEAQVRGYGPGRFSFNVKGGRCESCSGDGLVKVEMHFLPDVFVECQVCGGRRFNAETLEVTYKGKSIADVLEMTVEEAVEFFSAVPTLFNKLKTLNEVGLGYIHLGQSATTLSGGEAQRVKLSKELSKRATGKTVYILDEPTTGLHFEDVRKLLGVLQALVATGNTVIVIEHNLDVIKSADWVIDLGPGGGAAGGRIVAEGTPEDVAANAESVTGRYLKKMLESAPDAAPEKAPPKEKAVRVKRTRKAA